MDIWMISRSYEFPATALARAIAATFKRRKTAIPAELPDAFTRAFAEDNAKVQQWNSFVEGVAVKPGTLVAVIDDLAAFLIAVPSRRANLPDRQIGAFARAPYSGWMPAALMIAP